MKSIFCFFAAIFAFNFPAFSQENAVPPVIKPATTILGLILNSTKAEFETTYLPFVKKQIGTCPNCEIINLATYDEAGNYKEQELALQIESASPQVAILFVGWNQVKGKDSKEVSEALSKVIEKNVFVIGSAGYPKENADGASLIRTVLGENANVIVIGELTEREKLMKRSFFGPEMLTAVRLPKELRNQEGLGPLYFTSKLAGKWSSKSTQEWTSFLRNKKAQSKKLWPQTEDFFGYR